MFIGRTDAEVEAPILWPLAAKNGPIGEDPSAPRAGRAVGPGGSRLGENRRNAERAHGVRGDVGHPPDPS